ncbi:MAG TPA: hypothetical protein PL196_04830, partial [Burkholderiaceae bacterium]|nr:hypothetical protein [Burkholderiaceae bacterium]
STSQGSCGGAPALQCTLGAIPPGAQATVTATVRPLKRGSLTASASVTAVELDPDRANNSASTTTSVRRR